MTPNELYAKGYALEHSMWGVKVILEDPDHMDESKMIACHVIHFSDGPVSDTVSMQRGWEWAEADFVARRLTT